MEQEFVSEAEKLKSTMGDVTLNKLTKYVHKILGVYSLDCDYDINQEKCRCCNRKKLKLKVKREENINE